MAALEYRKLEPSEIEAGLAALSGWSVQGGKIAKTFAFETYKDGLAFVAAVGFLADAMDHHPDLTVGYRSVAVAINTHAVEGLSPFDFELARRIETLLGASEL